MRPLPALRADLSHCVGEVYGLRAPTSRVATIHACLAAPRSWPMR